MKISITKTTNSRIEGVDFDNLAFGRVFSDHMFVCDYKDGAWQTPQIVPFDYIPMHPAMMAVHYGQAIFEGMKATKSHDGTPLLFRPEMHAKRINKSAWRMCMPAFPENLFLDALHQLIELDQAWIPPQAGSALYIRPYMYASDEFIGVKPSKTYKMVIFTCPVGPYYAKPISLLAETKYIRAAEGGTGEAKAAGNYGGSLLPARLAQEQGYDQVLWLDAKEFKYIQEVGTMNIFFVMDGKIVTPALGGTILDGITRNSLLTILKDKGYTVEERPLSIDEVVKAHQAGQLQEVFGAGTAAVIAKISKIKYQDVVMELPTDNSVGTELKATIDGIRAQTTEDKFGWVVPVGAMQTV